MDDDAEILEALAAMFGALSEGSWKIHTANSPDAATEILNAGKINLLVVDINMPVIDGLQFAALMHKRHPALKIAVMTSETGEAKREAALEAGAGLFIEKPHSPEAMKAVFAMLGELLNWTPREGFQGMLRRVSLQDVIQMECVGRNSSIVEVCNENIFGRIYIEDGQILHAVAEELYGERAMAKLLSLPGGSFELAPFDKPAERTLNAPWEQLLAMVAPSDPSAPALVRAEKPEPKSTASAPVNPAASLVTETLVCTANGEPLYADGCQQPEACVQWLLAVAQQAAHFNATCSLGHFDRLEVVYPEARVAAQAREDRLVYVRVIKKEGA